MGYWEQSVLSNDADFGSRIAACVASEPNAPKDKHPSVVAAQIQWDVAAAPGFAEAYTYAIETGVENPGRDASVITDAQLLSAVQASLAELPLLGP